MELERLLSGEEHSDLAENQSLLPKTQDAQFIVIFNFSSRRANMVF